MGARVFVVVVVVDVGVAISIIVMVMAIEGLGTAEVRTGWGFDVRVYGIGFVEDGEPHIHRGCGDFK